MPGPPEPALAPPGEPTLTSFRHAVAKWSLRHDHLVSLLLLTLLAWAAQFASFRRFGLYEDDYFFVGRGMGADWSDIVDRLGVFTDWPQGRPLGFFLPDLFSFIGNALGGLPGVYLIGFAIIVLNSYLFFRLMRLRTPWSVALVGAAVFGLFPADTTKFLLTHDFQLQPGLTFLLLAGIAYANQRPFLAYPLSLGALLCYETTFLPFIGIPLLVMPFDRRLVRTMVWHLVVVAGIIGLVFALRLVMGEERTLTSMSGIRGTLAMIGASLVIGPAWALALLGYGPLQGLPDWDMGTLGMALLIGALAACTVWLTTRASQDRGAGGGGRSPPDSLGVVPGWAPVRQMAIAGTVLLVIGYGLAFTHFPPVAVAGRGTSVHVGATLGAAVIAASAYWALERIFRRRWVAAAPLIAGAYLALASGYSLVIASDFVRVWDAQREFWGEVAACCSDLAEGTVLIYEGDRHAVGKFIGAHSWADSLVLELTYRFPADWSDPPRLFTVGGWRDRVDVDAGDNGVRLRLPEGGWVPLPQANVIVLRREHGRIVRLTEPIDLGDGRLQLKPVGPPRTHTLAPGPLWPYMTQHAP